MQESKFLTCIGCLARGGNKILNIVNNILLVIVLLFGLYALWDTWAIFQGAGVSDGLLAYKPTLGETSGENPSLSELMALYPDVRAWLTLDDTNIDYPVVQGEDNSKYVNTSVEGEFSLSGAIFLDCQNEGDFSDLYNIVYGHHMEYDVMFGGLDNYTEEEYLEEHTTGYLFLEHSTVEIEIFASASVDAYDTKIFTVNHTDEDAQQELLEYIEDTANIYRDIGVDSDDRLIAMSTCSSFGTNARIVVIGRLTELEM